MTRLIADYEKLVKYIYKASNVCSSYFHDSDADSSIFALFNIFLDRVCYLLGTCSGISCFSFLLLH